MLKRKKSTEYRQDRLSPYFLLCALPSLRFGGEDPLLARHWGQSADGNSNSNGNSNSGVKNNCIRLETCNADTSRSMSELSARSYGVLLCAKKMLGATDKTAKTTKNFPRSMDIKTSL